MDAHSAFHVSLRFSSLARVFVAKQSNCAPLATSWWLSEGCHSLGQPQEPAQLCTGPVADATGTRRSASPRSHSAETRGFAQTPTPCDQPPAAGAPSCHIHLLVGLAVARGGSRP